MGVSLNAIMVSIALAFVHTILEFGYLYLEAKASKTSFINYCIVCFNGRFTWVPYNEYILSDEVTQSDKIVVIDFERLKSKVLCLEMSLEFTFNDVSIQTLFRTFARIDLTGCPRIKMRFGASLRNISSENFINLFNLSEGRVEIDLDGIDLRNAAKEFYYLLASDEEIEAELVPRDYLFYELTNKGLLPILKQLLQQNELLLDMRCYENDMNLLEYAIVNKDTDLVLTIISIHSEKVDELLRTFNDDKSLYELALEVLKKTG